MYWFRVWKLEEDFREGRVDERERFKYYLATLIAWSVVVYALIFSGTAFDVENLVFAGANLTVIVVGTVLCYRANRRGDDKDFIPRMICLGWPVGVKVALLLLTVFVLSVCIYTFLQCLLLFPEGGITAGLFVSQVAIYTEKFWGYFPGAFFLLGYFQTIHGELSRIAQPTAETETAELGKQRLEETPGGGTQSLERLSEGPGSLKDTTPGCLSGIGVIVLIAAGVVVIDWLELPKRLEILSWVGYGFTVSWLTTLFGRWEQARAQKKSA